MTRELQRTIAIVLALMLLLPESGYGSFGDWPIIGPIVKTAEKIPILGPVVKKADDLSDGIQHGVTKAIDGTGRALGGIGKVLEGDSAGWKEIGDGLKAIGTGAVIVVAATGVTVLASADPIIGTLFFGTPSPLQGITKFLYDTISRWKGQPVCNPQEQINRLMLIQKNTLGDGDRIVGAFSTPLKYISSIFDGYGAWEPTGCDAIGIGKPVRTAQHSTDGFWTIDLAVLDLNVQGAKAPLGRFIRLEVIPGAAAHESVDNHLVTPNDVVRFSGPMMWDRDIDADHPHGHMEVHPFAALQFGGQVPPQPAATSLSPKTVLMPPVDKSEKFPARYVVLKGDSLSKVAERAYGRQVWQVIFRANRKTIGNPDLIYPDQELELPLPHF